MSRFHSPLLWIVIGIVLATISGCARSPSSRFYLLDALSDSASPEGNFSDNRCVSIGIGPVEIPDYLDQKQIVTRVTPNEIKLAEYDRWAESLKDNLTRVLAKNLSRLLCIKEISFFPWRREIPKDYRIEVKVIRFDGSLGDSVVLEAWWTLLSGDGKTLLQSKRSNFSEPANGRDYKSLVSAQDRNLASLSREIAEAILVLSK
ncbi:MAG TPA: PqiC family protein [Thermodesulfobacteriota bacterium]|nr:PqiC family protein [Thermodesulfobacteriota bacterium]